MKVDPFFSCFFVYQSKIVTYLIILKEFQKICIPKFLHLRGQDNFKIYLKKLGALPAKNRGVSTPSTKEILFYYIIFHNPNTKND